MERQEIVEKISRELELSERQASRLLNEREALVLCIIALYKYWDWAKQRFAQLTVDRLYIDVPYYGKDPVFNLNPGHIVQLSKRSLFRQLQRETGCKFSIEQVMFLDKKQISALNRVLTRALSS